MNRSWSEKDNSFWSPSEDRIWAWPSWLAAWNAAVYSPAFLRLWSIIFLGLGTVLLWSAKAEAAVWPAAWNEIVMIKMGFLHNGQERFAECRVDLCSKKKIEKQDAGIVRQRQQIRRCMKKFLWVQEKRRKRPKTGIWGLQSRILRVTMCIV